ncbi:MAG: hypothetical protein EF813_03590 [Methanosarcinales archaeon]|nr:MAG: hypothetical protein EF813_03590 [Methanosarcinales archaeon]
MTFEERGEHYDVLMESPWYLDGWHIGYVDVINKLLNIHPVLFKILSLTPFLSVRSFSVIMIEIWVSLYAGPCMQSRSVPKAPFAISVLCAPAIPDPLLPVLIVVVVSTKYGEILALFGPI